MKRAGLVTSVCSAMAIAGCMAPTDSSTEEVADTSAASRAGGVHAAHACADSAPGEARCHAHVVLDGTGQPLGASSPVSGSYLPADLQAAYDLGTLPSSAGAGQTVALVDAYDYPTAESDLAAYRAQLGLPECSTANGCFRKVNQKGQAGSYPPANSGWSQESALDIEMVSAICPNCNILLVEANSNSFANLGAAVNTAVALGATVVSNSYGGGEYPWYPAFYDTYYNHPSVMITVSSGDAGYGVEYPAASRYVTAVGGTSLTKSSSARGWSETAWSGAGSGCSRYSTKPSWQKDSGCSRRTVADVSAVADPWTGVAVYWSGGWYVFGGTSVASPIIASIYALAGNAKTLGNASHLYSSQSSLNDVTSGTNGSCGGSYLCTAGAQYDGPTGLGTPSGTAAF